MRAFVFLTVLGVVGSAAWLLFAQYRRYRTNLAADARARELLETWDERSREAKRVDEWKNADPRNGVSR